MGGALETVVAKPTCKHIRVYIYQTRLVKMDESNIRKRKFFTDLK